MSFCNQMLALIVVCSVLTSSYSVNIEQQIAGGLTSSVNSAANGISVCETLFRTHFLKLQKKWKIRLDDLKKDTEMIE
uniref:Uncharacterized protein n=1 Tax=Ditylenchus dipsaci TaxID=166011 RepID=A0A915D1G8_9BILA